MTRGVVLFGVNNTRVDYIRLAILAACFIKQNMPGVGICLITDEHSKLYYEGLGKPPLNKYFSHVVLLPNKEEQFENTRAFRDTRYHSVEARFRNETRSSAYDLSPFDETILLDSDYLICNDVLNECWGSDEEIMINNQAMGLDHTRLEGPEFRLNPFGIRMYWATAIYFKKGEKAKLLFKLVEHIKDNWEFYKLTYDFPGALFRNDFAFAIAIHILNGFNPNGGYVTDLPDPVILTALDTDQFFKIRNPKDLSFFMNDRTASWKFQVSRLKGLNVHCMNKLSLINHLDQMMEVLE